MINKSLSFLIVDDHEFIIQGVLGFLKNHFPKAKFETAKSAEEVISILKGSTFSFVLSDVSLPGKSGIDLAAIVKEKYPNTKIIMLTQHTEVWIIKKLLKQNVDAIVLKENEQQEILNALTAVNNSQKYYTPIVQQIIIGGLTGHTKQTKSLVPELTKREKEILKLIVDELTTKKIAEKLYLSEKTVEVHRRNLFLKLDVKNSIGLVKKAIELDLFS